MKNVFYFVVMAVMSLMLTSCGTFGQGMLVGLASFCESYGDTGYSNCSNYSTSSNYSSGSGSLDYLLDPNYAIAQTMAQEDQEYQEFARYNKKTDGSNYTKDEWRTIVGQAISESKKANASTSNSSSDTEDDDTSDTEDHDKVHFGYKECHLCHGTGVCSSCNGKGWFFSEFGTGKVACPNCYSKHNGKCGLCGGTGKIYGLIH